MQICYNSWRHDETLDHTDQPITSHYIQQQPITTRERSQQPITTRERFQQPIRSQEEVRRVQLWSRGRRFEAIVTCYII